MHDLRSWPSSFWKVAGVANAGSLNTTKIILAALNELQLNACGGI